MACGTGKTLAALFLAETLDAEADAGPGAVAVAAGADAAGVAGQRHEAVRLPAVCSDETVRGPRTMRRRAHQRAWACRSRPTRIEIAAFLRQAAGRGSCSPPTSPRPQIAAAHAGRVPGFDLVIADEAHRCAGRCVATSRRSSTRRRSRRKRRLFMTATPRYFTGRVVEGGAGGRLGGRLDGRRGEVRHRCSTG